jgi:hypothetical protein
MKTQATGSALALLLSLAACSSVHSPALQPLTVLRHENLLRVVEPSFAAMKATAIEAGWESGPRDSAKIGVSVELYGVDLLSLRQALGDGANLFSGAVVSRAEADGLKAALAERVATGACTQIHDAGLTIFAGGRANVLVVNQRAYISGFQISSTADVAIADPRIDIAEDGILLLVDVEPIGQANEIAFGFELLQSTLDRDFEERDIQLLPGLAPVTLQLPHGISCKTTGSSRLSSDEALVFTGSQHMPGGSSRAMLAILTVEVAQD